jgi:hypothetical protein
MNMNNSLYYPSFLLYIVFFGIVMALFNYDEEFVIFLCLLIIFLTLMETLGDHVNEYASEKTSKIKLWYFTNWNLHLNRIKSNSELLFFIENFYNISFIFFVKILNSFFYFISYNFYLKNIYSSLLVKELLYTYEFLELNADLNSKILRFNKKKENFLAIIKNKNNKFPIKTLKLALNKLNNLQKVKKLKITKNLNVNLIKVLKKLTKFGKIKKKSNSRKIKDIISTSKNDNNTLNSNLNSTSKKKNKKSKK